VAQTEAATRKGAFRRIEVFEYTAGPDAPALPEWGGWAEGEEPAPKVEAVPVVETGGSAAEARIRAEFEKRLTDETHRSFESGRDRGRQEGRLTEQEAQAAAHAETEKERARQAAQLIESFTQERDRFLHSVEHEVVKLALAVAARILRREAQMDPLRVPPAELDLWTEAITLLPNLAVKPTVLAGEGMRLGDCKIETELGTVDLGIRSQLGEIEHGFFDRAGGSRSEKAKTEDAEMVGAGQESRG